MKTMERYRSNAYRIFDGNSKPVITRNTDPLDGVTHGDCRIARLNEIVQLTDAILNILSEARDMGEGAEVCVDTASKLLATVNHMKTQILRELLRESHKRIEQDRE